MIFGVANGAMHSGQAVSAIAHRWQAPRLGVFKISTDAATYSDNDAISVGVVIRDSNGLIKAFLCQSLHANY